MRQMEVGRDLVKPAEPTWTGRMPLTESDQTGVLTHLHTIYFYTLAPPQEIITIAETLKTSLSRLLVHFYPLAGRLRWLPGSRLELDCNAEGVLFIQAYSDAEMADLLGDITTAPPHFSSLIPQINYLEDDIQDIPIICVKLTEFRCGGVALAFANSHAVVDGRSGTHFLSEWARLARGEPLAAVPVLDRRLLRAGEPPSSAPPRFEHPEFDPLPLLLGESSCEKEKRKETAVTILKMTGAEVGILKKAANWGRPPGTRAYSRHEAIAAHIWRCACRARQLSAEQPTALLTCVDVRRRLKPPLPDEFLGNAIVDVVVRSLVGEVTGRPLVYAAGIIREAVEGVTSEYVHSSIDLVKKMEDLSSLQDIYSGTSLFYGNPNIGVISWTALPNLRGLDFGWGGEMLVAPGTFDGDGDSVVLPGYDGDDGSLTVTLCLQAECMEDFKRFFYEDIHSRLVKNGAVADCNSTAGYQDIHNLVNTNTMAAYNL